ncbi:MAG: hypothetical protein ACK5D5_01020 [Bacteroidota bacterium]|jgi:hypothetical protein
MKVKKKNAFPFPFVLDLIQNIDIEIKPMFGCHAVYSGEKILIILRNKESHTDSNGIWIATDFDHHNSLSEYFGGLNPVSILSGSGKNTAWQMIRYSDDHFEEKVGLLCELINKKDKRIGKIPRKKTKK